MKRPCSYQDHKRPLRNISVGHGVGVVRTDTAGAAQARPLLQRVEPPQSSGGFPFLNARMTLIRANAGPRRTLRNASFYGKSGSANPSLNSVGRQQMLASYAHDGILDASAQEIEPWLERPFTTAEPNAVLSSRWSYWASLSRVLRRSATALRPVDLPQVRPRQTATDAGRNLTKMPMAALQSARLAEASFAKIKSVVMRIRSDHAGDMFTQAFGVRVGLSRLVQVMLKQCTFGAPFVNRDTNTRQRHCAQNKIQNTHSNKMGLMRPILKPGAALC